MRPKNKHKLVIYGTKRLLVSSPYVWPKYCSRLLIEISFYRLRYSRLRYSRLQIYCAFLMKDNSAAIIQLQNSSSKQTYPSKLQFIKSRFRLTERINQSVGLVRFVKVLQILTPHYLPIAQTQSAVDKYVLTNLPRSIVIWICLLPLNFAPIDLALLRKEIMLERYNIGYFCWVNQSALKFKPTYDFRKYFLC